MVIKVWSYPLDDPLELDVNPTDTIGSLKSMIQRALCISDEDMEQRLLVIDDRRGMYEVRTRIVDGTRELPLDRTSTTLLECGLDDGDSLRLGFKGPFAIKIEFRFGNACEFEVRGCDETIGDLKRRIMEKAGVAVGEDNFPRELMSAGTDDRTLLSFGIYKVATDDYELFQRTIFGNPDNEYILSCDSSPTPTPPPSPPPLPMEDDDGASDVSPQLQLVVEFPNMPWRTPLLYEPTVTIGTMRKDITSMGSENGWIIGQRYIKEGLFVIFLGRMQLKDESATLADFGIKHMDSIQVFEDALFPIFVHGLQTLPVEMKCFDTVGMLKEKLQDATGVPKCSQRLIYKGWYLDDDERRLVYYGITKPVKYGKTSRLTWKKKPFWDRPEEEFHILLLAHYNKPKRRRSNALKELITELQITVEIPNTMLRFPLSLKPTDTICTVRQGAIDKCSQLGEQFDKSYIKEGMFVLFFNKQQLQDESLTLDNIGIGHMDSIQLFENASFDMDFVAAECRLRTTLDVRCYDTVGMLKERLEVVTGIPKKQMHLKYLELSVDWFLDDEERFLVDYGISEQVCFDGDFFPQDPEICVASSKRGVNFVWDF